MIETTEAEIEVREVDGDGPGYGEGGGGVLLLGYAEDIGEATDAGLKGVLATTGDIA